jgi:hypothetical protein
MITLGELLLEFVKSLLDLKDKLSNANRDKINRVAELLEHISEILTKAADEFSQGGRPVEIYAEVQEYINIFYSDFLKGIYKDKDRVAKLHKELLRALRADYSLLSISKKGRFVDSFTIRPYLTDVSYYEFQKLVGKESFQITPTHKTKKWEESRKLDVVEFVQEKSPILYLSEEELNNIISSELDKIREASGLFRATAKTLRVGINVGNKNAP